MKRMDIDNLTNTGAWISIADAITAIFFVFLVVFIVTLFIQEKQENDFNAYVKNMIDIAKTLGYETYGEKIEFEGDGFFESGSALLSADAKKKLDILSDSLLDEFQRIDQLVMVVIGHTDDDLVIKSKNRKIDDNWDLSAQRAKQTREYLVNVGRFPKERVLPAGFADQFPKSSNEREEGKSKNRRIELFLTHMNSIGGKIKLDGQPEN